MAGPVILVDDEEEVRRANAQSLELAGFEVTTFASASDALGSIDSRFAGVVVTDVRMPGIDGRELFRSVRRADPELPVILITGHGDIPMAVDAMREGAYDFLAKPFPADRLVASVRRALEQRRLVLENRDLRAALDRAEENDVALLGETPEMDRLRRTLRDLAQADVDVLVLGETGSGKELVAHALHRWGARGSRQFVALNCGALPESVIESELFGHEAGAFTGAQKRRIGRIEHAHGGTLFLDEIESMPLSLQVKLLRVLEQRAVSPLGTNEVRPVDLRVVAATKTDLGEAAGRGEFRADLYYRLNVVTVRVPSLRERRGDVPLLFEHFSRRASARFKRPVPPVTAAVRQHLEQHAWPGNVRELAHFAERFVLGLADLDGPTMVDGARTVLTLPERVDAFERELIRRALASARGDVKATVEALGVPRKTFYDKLQRHGIDPNEFRPGRDQKPGAG